jgi:DNA-binding CsgD family transcriptional regulator
MLSLVGALHQGAAGQRSWICALDRLSDAFGGGAVLIGTTPDGLGSFKLVSHRMPAGIDNLINNRLSHRLENPIFCAVPRAPLHCPTVASTLIDEAALLASPVYQQVMCPSDVRYVMTTVLDIVDGGFASVSFGRPARLGDFGPAEVATATKIAPHLAAALRVRRELEAAQMQKLAANAALDLLDRGVLLVTERARLCHANREAERILAEADGLLLTRDGLRTVNVPETEQLLRLIATCAQTTVGSEAAGGALSVTRPSGQAGYSVRVAPLGKAGAFAAGATEKPCAALFVGDNERPAVPEPDLLRSLYGLSSAEATLACKLFAGAKIGEAAASLGISPNTAKTQLKSIFDKTGTARQADLARRIALDAAALRRL